MNTEAQSTTHQCCLERLREASAALEDSERPVGVRTEDLRELERKAASDRPGLLAPALGGEFVAGFEPAGAADMRPVAVALAEGVSAAPTQTGWLITYGRGPETASLSVVHSSAGSAADALSMIRDAVARDAGLVGTLAHWEYCAWIDRNVQALQLAMNRRRRRQRAELDDMEQQTSAAERQPSVSGAEFLAKRRAALQNGVAEQLRLAERDFEKACGQRSGALFTAIETQIAGLARLEWRDAGPQREARIPAHIEQKLLEQIRTLASDRVASSISWLDERIEDEARSIAESFQDRYGQSCTLSAGPIDRVEIDELIEGSVRLDRPFRGRAPRRRLFQQLMEARRFLMIFFMLASALGLSALRGHAQWAAPISVTLLAAGALVTLRSARHDTAREEAQQLEKARESLQAEAARMLVEIQRGWQRFVKGQVAQQTATLAEQMEAFGKRAEAARQEQANRHRKRLQARRTIAQKRLGETEHGCAATSDLRALTGAALAEAAGELRMRLRSVANSPGGAA